MFCDSFFCDGLIAETSQSRCNDSFFKKYVGECVSIVGEGKKLHKRILIEANFDFKHILLGFTDDSFQQAQSAIDRDR